MSLSDKPLLKHELSLTFNSDTRSWVGAAAFVLVFSTVEALYSQDGMLSAFASIAGTDDILFRGVYLFYIVSALYLFFGYVLTAINGNLPVKIILVGFFGFACLTEYSYLHAVGRFTTYADVIAAISATSEQRADSLFAFVNPIGLVPALALVAASMIFGAPKERRSGVKPAVFLSLACAAFFFHLTFVDRNLFDRQFRVNSFIAFGETIADLALYTPLETIDPVRRMNVPAVPDAPPPSNNVVLIFDESLRGDHLSLNGYQRKTTPYLEELERSGRLANWGVAVSSSTSSHPSYNAFITGATPDEIARMNTDEINSLPTIFQFAKAAGYRTWLVDGQMMEYWGGVADDLNYIDEYLSLAEIDNPLRVEDWQRRGAPTTDENYRTDGMKQWDIDVKIARIVRDVYRSSTGNFIFVYKRGVHFPYEKNYPDDQAAWRPIYRFREQYEVPGADNHQGIVNSYDNALRFGTDRFFRELGADFLQLPNQTVVLYTSDHGESFYVNGRAGHGGDSPGEAAVPLFVLGIEDLKSGPKCNASHHNMFAAMLDLMSYPEVLRPRNYTPSFLQCGPEFGSPRAFNTPTGKKVAFE